MSDTTGRQETPRPDGGGSPIIDDVVQSNISRYWGRHAGSYDAYQTSELRRAPARKAWADIWARALPAPPSEILDVGTGTGCVSLLLAELGYRVTGIDLAEGMLERARANAEGMANPPSLQLGDAVAPGFSRYVLWTLRQSAVALENWRTLLRPGGTLAVVDSTWFPDGIHAGVAAEPGSKQEEFRTLYDERVVAALPLAEARTIDDTVALVRAAGFADISVTPLYEILKLDRRLGVPRVTRRNCRS
jgi:SAM-dependent methyltransferase